MRIDLSKTLFILPNLFTLGSVLCGFYAILICSEATSHDDLYRAALLIIYAMFFDTIDGRVARLTKTQSAMGVQLDSLADIVSFGVAPAILVYHWSLQELSTLGMLVGFVFVAAGAIRLARFNISASGDDGAPEKPGKYSQGMPIPAAAGILISLVVANHLTSLLPFTPIFISVVMISLAVFMVSSMPFRSFKDIKLSGRTFIFISIALVTTAAITLHYHLSLALVWLLVAYVAIGIIESVMAVVNRANGVSRRSR